MITIPNLKIAVVHQMKSNSEMSLQKVLRTCNLEDEKIARIYVTYYKDTVDLDWTLAAFSTVNPDKVTYVKARDLKVKEE